MFSSVRFVINHKYPIHEFHFHRQPSNARLQFPMATALSDELTLQDLLVAPLPPYHNPILIPRRLWRLQSGHLAQTKDSKGPSQLRLVSLLLRVTKRRNTSLNKWHREAPTSFDPESVYCLIESAQGLDPSCFKPKVRPKRIEDSCLTTLELPLWARWRSR